LYTTPSEANAEPCDTIDDKRAWSGMMAPEAVMRIFEVVGLIVIGRQVHETVIFDLRGLESLASLLKDILLVVFLPSFCGPLALFKLLKFFLDSKTR
jgi:hypothetical protein